MGLITDINGVKVGHYSDFDNITGCTVILFNGKVAGSVDISGGGTSTRQIDGLLPHHFFANLNAILLTGGSAYGLDAASGVMKFLEEKGKGLKTGSGFVVPSVPTAVIYDLGIGNGSVRPNADSGYNACLNASKNFEEGSIGAGTGATIGKYLGLSQATKGGLASESCSLPGGIKIGVLSVVNAFGGVYDCFDSNQCIAGVRDGNSRNFLDTAYLIKKGIPQTTNTIRNTNLSVVVTNAQFNKDELQRIAGIANTGICRAINPCHTISDGDMVFAVSCGAKTAKVNNIGVIAAEVVSKSIVRAVKISNSLGGIPAYSDIFNEEN